MTTSDIPKTVKIGGREMRVFKGVMEGWDKVEIENAFSISIRFRITHLDHFCIVCGWRGSVRLLGTFVSPLDKLEYPYCLCPQHDPEAVEAGTTTVIVS